MPDGFVHGSTDGVTVYRWGALEDGQKVDRRGRNIKTRKLETVSHIADVLANRCVIVADASIRHNAIAIGGGKVYLIDRPLALFDRFREPEHETGHPTGVLVSLDISTGEPQWKIDDDVYGTTLLLSETYNALLMCYQPDRKPMALLSELGGRMTVFDTDTGERIWEKKASYVTRPLINDQTVYAQGGAWDLLSGEDRPFNF